MGLIPLSPSPPFSPLSPLIRPRRSFRLLLLLTLVSSPYSPLPRVPYAPHRGPYTSDQFPCSHLGPSRDPGNPWPMLGHSSTFLDLSSLLSLLFSPFFARSLPFSSSRGPPPKNFKSGARVTRATNASRRPATTITRGVSFDRTTQNIAAARYPRTSQKRKRGSRATPSPSFSLIARELPWVAFPLLSKAALCCVVAMSGDQSSKKNRIVTNRREISMERGEKRNMEKRRTEARTGPGGSP